MKHIRALLAFLIFSTSAVLAADKTVPPAKAILMATGEHGGLSLVTSKDGVIAIGLVQNSNLHVRQHYVDRKNALKMASFVSQTGMGERISVRDEKLVTAHYGSELFNLIVIDGWGKGAAEGVSLAELERILTPGGTLAVSEAKTDLTAHAAKLTLSKLPDTSGFMIWSKPVLVGEDWTDDDSRRARSNPKSKIKPCYNLRWRSGLQWDRKFLAHKCTRFANGRMAYLALEPTPGTDKMYAFKLIVRDGFNGRIIWSKDGKPFDSAKVNRNFKPGSMAIHGDRVYSLLDRKISCYDAETGKVIYTVKHPRLTALLQKSPTTLRMIRIHDGKYLIIGIDGLSLICDPATGEKIWESRDRVAYGPIENNIIYVNNRDTYSALNLADGKKIWSINGSLNDTIPKGRLSRMFCSSKGLHIVKGWQNPYRIDTLDLKTGKKLWTYRAKPIDFSLTPDLKYPIKEGKYKDSMKREAVGFDNYICLVQRQTLGWNNTYSYVTRIDAATGKVSYENRVPSGHKPCSTQRCYDYRGVGNFLHHGNNNWVDCESVEYINYSVIRSGCKRGTFPANRMVYSTGHVKGSPVNGMAALGSENFPELDYAAPPLKTIKRGSGKSDGTPTGPGDWPMYRGSTTRGNSISKGPGPTLVAKWNRKIGKGKLSYRRMTLERTGLTQAVSAWGMVFVSDLEGHRVVALDKNTGKTKWTFQGSSRVEFSPSLYKGMCIFGDREGWIYCLDAKTGAMIYKLLGAPAEAYIGGREAIQSLWPVHGVAIIDDVAYAAAGVVANMHGGITLCSFDPVTGEVKWKQRVTRTIELASRNAGPRADIVSSTTSPKKKGTVVMFHNFYDKATGAPKGVTLNIEGTLTCKEPLDNQLASNHMWWNSADHSGVQLMEGRRTSGPQIAFNKKMGISFIVAKKGAFRLGPCTLAARSAPKTQLWQTKPTMMNADGMALTDQHLYVTGHFETQKRPAELQVLSVKDGSLLSTATMRNTYPTFDGLSVTDDSVFVVTRDGRLLCYAKGQNVKTQEPLKKDQP